MRSPRKIAPLARWGLVCAAILMGASLLATVWSSYRGVARASETLLRGQANALQHGIRASMLARDPDLDAADLAAILAEHADAGLAYIALLDARGAIVGEAGEPATPREALRALAPEVATGAPRPLGDRVVASRRLPRRRPPGAQHPPPPPPEPTEGPLAFIIEFEPRIADELRSAAVWTLGIGAASAGMLLLAALVLVRWFLRREALERQLEQGRRLSGLGQMSAVLAHELRNPLASLKGNAQLLARSLGEGDRASARAQRVVDEAIRLEKLTNDLLEFARLGALHRSELDPAALLRDAVAKFDPGRVEVVSQGSPAAWSLDGARLLQVLTNLLDNALQADDGRVQASVSEQRGRLEFVVRDWGEGIPLDELERIFEPFYTRRVRGTGLGLAIARRIVELHGGTLTAANAEGRGAVFTVAIPRT